MRLGNRRHRAKHLLFDVVIGVITEELLNEPAIKMMFADDYA